MGGQDILTANSERILQDAPVSIMLIDAGARVTFVNDWHLVHFARGRHDRRFFLGKHLRDLPGIVSAGILDEMLGILEGRTVHLEAVYAATCSGGQPAYQNIRGIPIVENGAVVGGIVIREDVTQLVRSTREIREHHAIFKALFDAAHDSILLFESDGTILMANEEAARRRGRTVAGLIGDNLYHYMTPELADLRRRHVQDAMTHNRHVCYEERQDDRCFLVSLCPIADETGRVRRIASYCRDISALKETENQLRKEKELAFSANQAKSQFLANMTHELRTPLNGILGATQLAMQGAAAEDQAELWDIVNISGKRLLSIVENVLELADIDAAAIEPVLTVCDVPALLGSLARSHAVRAKVKGLRLTTRLDAGIPKQLVGDVFRLRQILSNLLDNALKCTKSGSVEIRAKKIASSRIACAPNYRTVLFMIRDTGIGIAKERQARIFEDFELAEPYLTKRVSGAGVGLGIARHLVEMLGGRIWVKSALQRGSTFYCAIPFALPDYGCQSDAVFYPSGDTVFSPSDHTVLLVEDERINRLTTVRTLARLGYKTLLAVDGQEALAILSRKPVDIILMDIQMPVMDGIECTHHIRNGEVPGLSKRIPIIALTAYASEKDRERLLALGMNDYLAKPHSIDQLAEVLEANLNGLGVVRDPGAADA
jgi:PAS domain S-box-containing protein